MLALTMLPAQTPLLPSREEGVFFLDHELYHFPPWMVLAADGVHPSFGGVSLLAWKIHNLLLQVQRPAVADWRDCAVPAQCTHQPVTASYAQAASQRPQGNDTEAYRSTGARPKIRAGTAATPPAKPPATLSPESQSDSTRATLGDLSATHSNAERHPRTTNRLPAAPASHHRNEGSVEASPGGHQPLAEEPTSKYRCTPDDTFELNATGRPQATEHLETTPSVQGPRTNVCTSSMQGPKITACTTPITNRYDLRRHCGSARRVPAD
ncbi:hypothetical protein HPB52_002524 [Rhipicephalus sanguineus]|uniref:Uncharacterized protein n=1 Tax=Rhipicephalus sanguineus TaxID=34632 RepID=A0A9D4T8H4_RHISA|nr:hypothetical protein HPB52_002524 [Rhipicephalus sanguineus]